jgi:hypothetical protein
VDADCSTKYLQTIKHLRTVKTKSDHGILGRIPPERAHAFKLRALDPLRT